MCCHDGLIQLASTFNQSFDELAKVSMPQQRRGGNQV
jgi:hypothetical protein